MQSECGMAVADVMAVGVVAVAHRSASVFHSHFAVLLSLVPLQCVGPSEFRSALVTVVQLSTAMSSSKQIWRKLMRNLRIFKDG